MPTMKEKNHLRSLGCTLCYPALPVAAWQAHPVTGIADSKSVATQQPLLLQPPYRVLEAT